MSCYDVNANNDVEINYTRLSNEIRNPSTPPGHLFRTLDDNNNKASCRYNQVCKNMYSTDYDSNESDRTKVHSQSECNIPSLCRDPVANNTSTLQANKGYHVQSTCTYDNVCRDDNATNTENSEKGKHLQSTCQYRSSCPYSGVNIKNHDPNHNPVSGRDNCQFRTPKCLNSYADNFNQDTTEDSEDSGNNNNFNYGCDFNYGCTDTEAHNYSSDAKIDDGSCTYRRGCRYTQAPNYRHNAEIDDGSCEFISGCTYSEAQNYDRDASFDDGSCIFSRRLLTSSTPRFGLIQGCLDPSNSNYNRDADYDLSGNNGPMSCASGTSVNGCIDPNALNYNPNATIQTEQCDNIDGCTYEQASNYNSNANRDNGSCEFNNQSDLENNNYTIIILILILIILGLTFKLLG